MKNIAPYQVFFPIGIMSGLLAIGVWLTQNFEWTTTPAMIVHPKLVVGGFLWSFIVGFLMTAVPRMTGTSDANKFEYGVALLLILSLIASSWILSARPFYTASAILVLFLMTYAGRRILTAKKTPPVFFSHVGIGMLLALIGSYYHDQGHSLMGLHLYHVGTILLLVLGIGTRFFSFLSGLHNIFEKENSKWQSRLFHVMGILMALLLYLAGTGKPLAYLGLAVLSLGYIFLVWRIQRPSDRPSPLKWAARIVAVVIPLSFFLCWLFPLYLVTWLHILFIGCFGLLTFSVATRVTLAHGAYPTDIETKSPALWWMVGLLTLALIFRLIYGLMGGDFRTHFLHMAILFWILALGIWCKSYFIRIFKTGPLQKPAC